MWKKLGQEGLAVKAPWPEVGEEDKLLTRQAAFLSKTLSHFRAQLGKAKKGWKEATILVTDSYPEWKVTTLKWMQEQHDGSSFPKTFMKDLKVWTGANVPDKKQVKFTMQFASFIKKEVDEVGAVAMDTELPFDQTSILQGSEAYITAQLSLPEFKIVKIGDESAKDVPDKVAENVSPGKPYLWFN